MICRSLILNLDIVSDLKAQLKANIVNPMFSSIHPNGRLDPSLPEIVFENRRNRAHLRILDALTSRGVPDVPHELRTQLESLLETWRRQSFSDAFQPIQEFEIDCARERDLLLARQSGDPRQVLEVLESEYRRRAADRFGSVELRGIQLNHRVILDLDQVFVPLHFVDLSLERVDVDGQIVLSEADRRLSFVDIVKKNNRILLIGSPGSGKSTLLSFLASHCAVGNHGLKWPQRALPFVITVRELKDGALNPEWLSVQVGVSREVILNAIAEDRAVLLVDGLDEAPEQLRSDLVTALCSFGDQHPALPVVVTSRPAGGPGEIVSSLCGFRAFRMADLTAAEVDGFIDKWCLAAETSARSNSGSAAAGERSCS
jgi:hypothetical protein